MLPPQNHEGITEVPVGEKTVRLNSQPLAPLKDHWLLLFFLFIFGAVGLLLIIGALINDTEENTTATQGILLISFTAFTIGFCLLFRKVRRYQAFIDPGTGKIVHGQSWFQCQHDVSDILALQLLKAPVSTLTHAAADKKDGYQLNLVLLGADNPRCLFLEDVDFLALKEKGREFSEKMNVPLLDFVQNDKQKVP